jgi:hypothetical protein
LSGVLNEALNSKDNVLDILRVDAFLFTVSLYRQLGLLTPAQANALPSSANTLLLSVSRR